MGEAIPTTGCERQNDFGAIFGNGKTMTKKAKGKNNMETELQMLKEGPQVNIL